MTQSIWKMGAEKLPFWDSSMSHTGPDGYIDTFRIGKNYFRVIHNDTLYDGIVEKLENGKWILNIELPILGNHNDYDLDSDVNNDGYLDFVFYWKWDTEVFLFNPQTNRFSSKSFRHTSDWELLDKTKGIFCAFFESKFLRDYKSQLYTFKGGRPSVLYYLKFDVDRDANYDEVIKKITIYKASPQKKDIKVKVFKVNTDEFDYSTFWKKYYKMLLGSG